MPPCAACEGVHCTADLAAARQVRHPPSINDHLTQPALQDQHVSALAVRDGARIDRAGCLRNFGLYGLGRRNGVLGGWRLSISPASRAIRVPGAIGPTASLGARREFLRRGTITRAGIIPWHHGWPGKQAGGEKRGQRGRQPAARTNRFHPRLQEWA